MGFEGYLVGCLIVAMIVVMAFGRAPSDIVFSGGLLALLAFGVLTPKEAFAGYANDGPLTVAFLYVVATGLSETGAMMLATKGIFGRVRSVLDAQTRLSLLSASISAWINNTPLVAMLMPVVSELSRRTGIAPSRLFMHLSFAVSLGGTITLIGTSSNIALNGVMIDFARKNPGSGVEPMTMFTLAPVGLAVAIAGLAYMLAFGRKLLADNSDPTHNQENVRQYMTAMRVSRSAPFLGKSVEEAGLRGLPGLFLASIERGGEIMHAVSPGEKLQADDTLLFVGVVDSVIDLKKTRGLEPVVDGSDPVASFAKRALTEVVVSPDSPLIGRSIRDAEIRTRYASVVVAVHRHGHRLAGKLGDIVLRPGDTLLLDGPETFAHSYRNSLDFHLVSQLPGSAFRRHDRAWVALLILVVLILVMSFKLWPPVIASMAAAALMIATRCCTGAQARAQMGWQVLIVIGAAFGFGTAMEKTKLAALIAENMLSVAAPLGAAAALAGVYAMTVFARTVLGNTPTVVMMFPIAQALAAQAGVPFMPYAIAIAVGGSCEFWSPIGYQTNMMIMGPGGYQWGDYFRFGGPLTVLTGIVAVTAIALIYGL